jgi:hypothetical protein
MSQDAQRNKRPAPSHSIVLMIAQKNKAQSLYQADFFTGKTNSRIFPRSPGAVHLTLFRKFLGK